MTIIDVFWALTLAAVSFGVGVLWAIGIGIECVREIDKLYDELNDENVQLMDDLRGDCDCCVWAYNDKDEEPCCDCVRDKWMWRGLKKEKDNGKG